MRIGIDISVLQGGSAQRGMGRYTLQQLAAVVDDEHEYLLFHQPGPVRPALPDSIDARPNVRLVALDFPQAGLLSSSKPFTRDGERAYTTALQRFVEPHQLDLFHIACYDDNPYYYSPREWTVCPFAMTVYDLIPLHMAETFLTNPAQRASYMDALALVRRADALIAISEETRNDTVAKLGVSAERVFVAPPYAGSDIRPAAPDEPMPDVVKRIGGDYVYSVSGVLEHKNLKRLLRAFADVPGDVRLAVSAGVAQGEPPHLKTLVDDLNIRQRVVWLPRISEDDIAAVYRHARACAHVSLIEGFGMPILEAMQSGVPVVTSDRGVMREVAGTAAALVNPEETADIARGLTSLLTDEALREQHRAAGFAQAAQFNAARLAEQTRRAYTSATTRRLRVALWSPLPPALSGISDYTAEMIPSLARHVDLVVYSNPGVDPARFKGLPVTIRTYAQYNAHTNEPVDLHVYQMGNNLQFHEEIYTRLLKVPGIVILHELSLYFFYASLAQKYPDRFPLADEVAYSEGETARADLDRYQRDWSTIDGWDITKLPMGRRVAANSLLVVTHSPHTRDTLQARYPEGAFVSLPLATALSDRNATTARAPQTTVFGAFGGIHPVKRLHVLLEAFKRVSSANPALRLQMIGRNDDPGYLNRLRAFIRDNGLTGRVELLTDVAIEDFARRIDAVDVVVNLRWPTSGEMSATAMRALGAGKPVVMSDIPQFADLDPAYVWKVPVGDGEIEALERLLTRAASDPQWVREAGEAAYRFASERLSFEVVSEQYHRLIRKTAPKAHITAPPARGVNLLGDLRASTGLGEMARSMVHALAIAGIPTGYHETVLDKQGRTTEYDAPPAGQPHDINILHVSPPFLWELLAKGYDRQLAGKYNIAYWFYELPDFPANWAKICDVLDEIWVATRFVQESVQRVTKTPVYVMPMPMELGERGTAQRSAFGIPEGRFAFMFSFNPGSSAARKNPFGLFDAYERAFGGQTDKPLLVLKAQFLDSFPALAAEIRRRGAELGVLLIERNLSRGEMYDLIASCDCYVSLHRSEGWGLGMAEAMALGKPVIGTGWSGNVDFMSDENSYLVPYTLVTITKQHHRFQESYVSVFPPGSSVWAEPDIDAAASIMRRVVEHPEEAAAKGRRAAETIRRDLNASVLGERMRAHLDAIDPTHGKRMANRRVHGAAGTAAGHIGQHAGATMDNLRIALAEWDVERNRTTIRGFGRRLNAIPGIGFLWRTLIRVRNTGKVWGAESHVFDALAYYLDAMSRQSAAQASQLDALRESSTKANDEARVVLERINAQLTRMHGDIQFLRQAVVQLQRDQAAVQAAVRRLDEGYTALDDRTRLNTSQLRLMQFEAPPASPSLVDIVRWLEAQVPELARASRIDFTMHGAIDEAQTLALSEYWRGKVMNVRPAVWYHFDRTAYTRTPEFFDNARAKLGNGAMLAVVAWSDPSATPQPDGFQCVAQHQHEWDEQAIFVTLYRRVDSAPIA